MEANNLSGTLAVILHADVASSTELVRRDEQVAHARIQEAFRSFQDQIDKYQGRVLELRGDALLAKFERASDAVSAALKFQLDHTHQLSQIEDDLKPRIRVGIALGEVIIADNTVTGAGVVLAQRVEQLAHPDGVCITAALREALPDRLPFELETLGEQDLKGFEEPVKVYRAGLNPGAEVPPPQPPAQIQKKQISSSMTTALVVGALAIAFAVAYFFQETKVKLEPASIENMAYPLPEKPSIAVLPFDNLSNDPEQEFFADGMTEDLITDISKISGLFVIARNSVFTYKGKAVKINQVAEELGVRYVMEGSVRRSGKQVRVNAQLIDATTGGHLWAERYDGSLDDVFAMQDQITAKIVSALAVTLTGQGNSIDRETDSTTAYDAYLKGWEHYRRGTPEDFGKAIGYLEQALELDPEYSRARTALAAVYWNSTWRRWFRAPDLTYSQIVTQARNYLREAMKSPSALTHQIASEMAAYSERPATNALKQAEIAISLDGNDPAGYLARANALLKDRRPGEAIESMRQAMRLDPHFPAFYLTRLGRAQFDQGRYQEAAATLEESIQRNPHDDRTFMYLAATYGLLGKTDAAKSAVSRANDLRAGGGWGGLKLEEIPTVKWIGDRAKLRQGLKAADVIYDLDYFPLITRTGDSFEIAGAAKIDVKAAKDLFDRGVPFVAPRTLRERVPGGHGLNWWRGSNDARQREFNLVRLAEIASKDEAIVIYSLGFAVDTAEAAAYAVAGGFEKIYYLEGGIDAWKAAGYPTEKIN